MWEGTTQGELCVIVYLLNVCVCDQYSPTIKVFSTDYVKYKEHLLLLDSAIINLHQKQKQNIKLILSYYS